MTDDSLVDKDLIWHPGDGKISAAQMNAIRTRHANAIRPIPHRTAMGHEHFMADADRGALLAELDRLHAVPDETQLDRGFGNCPHCRSPLVTRCHECLNEISRDEAHAAGWRMDHLSGFGCIALCPDHK